MEQVTATESQPEPTILFENGKRFVCSCDCAVFTQRYCEEHDQDEYDCNVCGNVYA